MVFSTNLWGYKICHGGARRNKLKTNTEKVINVVRWQILPTPNLFEPTPNIVLNFQKYLSF